MIEGYDNKCIEDTRIYIFDILNLHWKDRSHKNEFEIYKIVSKPVHKKRRPVILGIWL